MDEENYSKQSAAQSLLRTLRKFCSSDSLSQEGLLEIIERHGLTSENDLIIIDYYFFFLACRNEQVNEGIIECLLEYFPDAASATNDNGMTPLHVACANKNMTLGVIRLLIDAAPDSLRMADNHGWMPLHILCLDIDKDEMTSIAILKLFIQKYPEAVRDNGGYLPIHIAAGSKSLEFCRLLIEAYPGSERIASNKGDLPLHHACRACGIDTVQYLYKLYPDAINHASTRGQYPIHLAINGVIRRDDPVSAAEIATFLLDCDPNVKLLKWRGESLLQCACNLDYNDSNIETGIEMISKIYDAHPEAIEDDEIMAVIPLFQQQVQAFINKQLVYARQANDHEEMTTPDGNGQLPLHRALQNNDIRLGSIKLLVRGNPSAIRNFDQSGAIPLHVACQHHDSTDVVRYLIGLDATTLDTVDRDGNTALHYACHGAKYDTIAKLLEDYDAVSVSRQNSQGKLPIDLLWESNEVDDRDDLEYVESIFRLLTAYPETMMIAMKEKYARAGDCSTQDRSRKKRKFGK